MFIGIGISLVGQLPHGIGGAPADTTAPVLSSPSGTQTSPTTATVGATTDEGNGSLYWVVTTSSTTPTAQQIIDGKNHLGAAAVAADFITVGSTGAKTDTATGLSASTAYYAHLVHEDVAGNRSNIVSSAQFTTAAAPDVTAPTLSSPTGTQTGSTTADLGVTSDEANGTLYVAVLPSASAAPTGAAFIAGTTGGVYTASDTTPTAGVNSFSATGLTASTGYKAHYFHEDTAGNDSNVASSATFTTTAVIAPVLTQTSTDGANPLVWTTDYTDAVIGSDQIIMRHRVNAGSWVTETAVDFTSDFWMDYHVDGNPYTWPLYDAAWSSFANGDVIDVQEGIIRGGVTTWSSTLSDTLVIGSPTMPSMLFDAGQFGFALDPRTGTYQNTTEATAATADTDPVRRIRDQSGNNKHFEAPSDAARPLLKVGAADGGAERYLSFNGSSQLIRLLEAGLYGSGSGTTTIVMAVKSDNTAQLSGNALTQANTANANNIYVPGTATGGTTATQRRVRITNNAGTAIVDSQATGGFAFNGNWNVLVVVDNGTSVVLEVYSGGALTTSATVAYTHSGTYTGDNIALGASVRNTTASYFNGRIGRVIAIRKSLSSGEKTSAISWVATNNGISVP